MYSTILATVIYENVLPYLRTGTEINFVDMEQFFVLSHKI